jgi:hypothetical protein
MAFHNGQDEAERFRTYGEALLKEQFDAYSVETRRAIRADVAQRLSSLHPQSALWRYAQNVLGMNVQPPRRAL